MNNDFLMIKVEKLIEWNEPNGDGCLVSDRITKDGYKVGYMYRDEPDEGKPDSGWRFMAGDEDDEYMDNPENVHIFTLNTVCNYDPDIIPYIHSKIGSTLIRINNKEFEIDHFDKPIFMDKQNRNN